MDEKKENVRMADMDALSAAHVQTVTVLAVVFAVIVLAALAVVGLSVWAARDANKRLAETTEEWIAAWSEYEYVSEETQTIYRQDGDGVNVIGVGNEVRN